jgi:hypothetical protein
MCSAMVMPDHESWLLKILLQDDRRGDKYGVILFFRGQFSIFPAGKTNT